MTRRSILFFPFLSTDFLHSMRERENMSLSLSQQIYSEVYKRDPALTGAGHPSALAPKLGDDDNESNPDDHRAIIEFSTTSYAILEREQKVELKIKRRGPVDVDVRFRCLFLAAHPCIFLCACICSSTVRYCIAKSVSSLATNLLHLCLSIHLTRSFYHTFDRWEEQRRSENRGNDKGLLHLDLRTSCQTAVPRWKSSAWASTGRSKEHIVEDRQQGRLSSGHTWVCFVQLCYSRTRTTCHCRSRQTRFYKLHRSVSVGLGRAHASIWCLRCSHPIVTPSPVPLSQSHHTYLLRPCLLAVRSINGAKELLVCMIDFLCYALFCFTHSPAWCSSLLHAWSSTRSPLDAESIPEPCCSSRLDTIDGTATAGEDYVKLSEEFKMEAGQQEKRITIHVIDDNQWEPDETFFVKLSIPDGQDTRAKLGPKTIALVTIINDDGEHWGIDKKIALIDRSFSRAGRDRIRGNNYAGERKCRQSGN